MAFFCPLPKQIVWLKVVLLPEGNTRVQRMAISDSCDVSQTSEGRCCPDVLKARIGRVGGFSRWQEDDLRILKSCLFPSPLLAHPWWIQGSRWEAPVHHGRILRLDSSNKMQKHEQLSSEHWNPLIPLDTGCDQPCPLQRAPGCKPRYTEQIQRGEQRRRTFLLKGVSFWLGIKFLQGWRKSPCCKWHTKS